ncbi:MAG: hypothetical protein WB774_19500, partial [Xanthobacteraceae bacterium]
MRVDPGAGTAYFVLHNTFFMLRTIWERGAFMLLEQAFKAVGKPVPRNEDQRLITGKGRFSDDFSLPGQVWAAMVRSPHP